MDVPKTERIWKTYRLPLQAREGDSLDEVALSDEEEDDHWKDVDQRGGHEKL